MFAPTGWFGRHTGVPRTSSCISISGLRVSANTTQNPVSNGDMVGEVRGIGLLGAIDLVADKASGKGFDPSLAAGNRMLTSAMSRGLLFRAAGSTLLFCLPLIVSETDIDEIFDIVTEALGEVQEGLHH